MKPFIQTTSGRAFPLLDPSPRDVHWFDVAAGLAHINRYSGNAGIYTVAQHSIIVANALPPELRPYGLLHDAHEFVVGDMTRPMKKALGPAVCFHLEDIEQVVDWAIYTAAGLPYPISPEIRHAVKRADVQALMTEKRDILTPMNTVDAEVWLHGSDVVDPLPETIVPWSNAHAQEAFYRELNRYGLT
jgi:5'-deoxynucleotidase YfbR-like HD superfamily hydrolase